MSKPYTVVAIIEAIPGKEKQLESALLAVVEPSRSEKACVEYRLHKSVDNPAQFFLYENWESKEKHAEQFEKSYIKDLVEKLDGVLAKPYQVFFGEELSQ